MLLRRGESAGQGRHERGGERHALREALGQVGAEAALEARELRVLVVSGGQSLLQSRRRWGRWLEHHGPVRHEHRVARVDEVSRAGLRGAPDQRVDAEGGGASEWPLHHHKGRAERCAHMNNVGGAAENRGRVAGLLGTDGPPAEPRVLPFTPAIIRLVYAAIPSEQTGAMCEQTPPYLCFHTNQTQTRLQFASFGSSANDRASGAAQPDRTLVPDLPLTPSVCFLPIQRVSRDVLDLNCAPLCLIELPWLRELRPPWIVVAHDWLTEMT